VNGDGWQAMRWSLSWREADMKIKYRVDLTDAEREHLLGLIGKGKHGARTLARARILKWSPFLRQRFKPYAIR
ncbi:MAG: hypothetical protein Q8O25_06820, partial [Sulfurisoma sp.]|nr:hypothetical protein [Sulfurisoma sp.]